MFECGFFKRLPCICIYTYTAFKVYYTCIMCSYIYSFEQLILSGQKGAENIDSYLDGGLISLSGISLLN